MSSYTLIVVKNVHKLKRKNMTTKLFPQTVLENMELIINN
jgi:hypothetical protein